MFDKIKTFVKMSRMAKDMMKDESAKMNSNVFGKVVGLFVISILIGSIFVTGLTTLADANTSSLSATEVALLAIVGLILIVGVLWLILEYVELV
jgi:hypothetical protein